MSFDGISKRIADVSDEFAALKAESFECAEHRRVVQAGLTLASHWETFTRRQATLGHRLVAELERAPLAEIGVSSPPRHDPSSSSSSFLVLSVAHFLEGSDTASEGGPRPGAARRTDRRAVILDGRDVLAVTPTGSGKSAIYQVPAVLLSRPVIVISPLIALQHDQIASLEQSGAPAAVAINSRQSAKTLDCAWSAIETGEARYVFLGPEQLIKDDLMKRLASLIVIDEVHCVSAWGHEFRPTYLRVGDAIERLGRLDATVRTSRWECDTTEDSRKRDEILEVVQRFRNPGLLYCATRKDAEYYAEQLNDRGVSAVEYHAGLSAAQRNDVHGRFRDDDVDVVVATSAFGMGVDKPNVRFVVHASVPDSVDAYYQQIGGAGRAGEPADTVCSTRPRTSRSEASSPPATPTRTCCAGCTPHWMRGTRSGSRAFEASSTSAGGGSPPPSTCSSGPAQSPRPRPDSPAPVCPRRRQCGGR